MCEREREADGWKYSLLNYSSRQESGDRWIGAGMGTFIRIPGAARRVVHNAVIAF